MTVDAGAKQALKNVHINQILLDYRVLLWDMRFKFTNCKAQHDVNIIYLHKSYFGTERMTFERWNTSAN